MMPVSKRHSDILLMIAHTRTAACTFPASLPVGMSAVGFPCQRQAGGNQCTELRLAWVAKAMLPGTQPWS